nr:cadmium-translocating P-type ATPase [Hyphomonadaceae bacterium]
MVSLSEPASRMGATPLPSEAEVLLASRNISHAVMETHLVVPTARCAGCIRSIEGALSSLDTVVEARVNLSTRRVKVKWRAGGSPPPLLRTLSQAGFDATLSSFETDGRDPEMDRLVRATAVAGFAMMNIMLLSVSIWSGADPGLRSIFHVISALLAAPVIVYSGRIFFESAWSALKVGKANMDVPIAAGILLTFALSAYDTVQMGPHAYFDAATSLIFVLLVGRTLDHMMRRKARTAVMGLARLMPHGATVVEVDGRRAYTSTDLIHVGQIVLVSAGDRIPLDGVIVSGDADLDTAIVNGESTPVRAEPGTPVLSGMLNINGRIEVRVSRTMPDSFISSMINMMEAAEIGRAHYRRLADRAASLYTPVVHALAAGSFIAWMIATGSWHQALTIAVSVLVITCPCALGLAVPMVHVMAARRLFELRIALKDGSALERAAEADTVVFDKTGTLTFGRMQIVSHTVVGDDLLAALALAACSRHPASQAIASLASEGAQPGVENVREYPGLGVEGRIGRHTYRLGRTDWVQDGAVGDGVGFAKDRTIVGKFELADVLRPDAIGTILDLRAGGYHIEILSGDSEGAVGNLAARLGVKDFHSSLRPEDKVRRLKELGDAGRKVLMVGDGLNDAPALSAAHVSMAPGDAADIGRAAADFVFMGGLDSVSDALRISRKARRLVHQNLVLAVIYNVVAVPFALAGFVTPLVAAIAMSASSLTVVVNALRLSPSPHPSNIKPPPSRIQRVLE